MLSIVGTDVHPFDRLVSWIDAWAAEHPAVDVFQQIGQSAPPAASASAAFLPLEELRALIERAAVVVSHGGPATIADIRQTGRKPIVFPRDPRFGEHVDSHQQRYAAYLVTTERAWVVTSRDELESALEAALEDPERVRCEISERPLDDTVRRFARLVASLAPPSGS